MKRFQSLQNYLENTYGVKTNLDIVEFIRPLRKLDNLGKLIIDQSNAEEPNVALLLDQDIFEAWASNSAAEIQSSNNSLSHSVVYEELSHFVYFAYNHQRGRNITALEMETQSEIDRILLAFHCETNLSSHIRNKLLSDLLELPYSTGCDPRYEESRQIAKNFLLKLSNPNPETWTPKDFVKIRRFFHTDLSGKIQLSKQNK